MVVGERKTLAEIKEMISGFKRVLIVGCDTCMKVCLAGGQKEVEVLASALWMTFRLEGNPIEFEEATIERQCENEFIDEIAEAAAQNEAILSMGCGAGVQALAERFPTKPVLPAVNTTFIGILEDQGIWSEKCIACGDCKLSYFGGVCPITHCAKGLLNGPCGGSRGGKCEVNPEMDCAWQLIYDRLKALGQLERLEEFVPPNDWSKAHQAGPRVIIREDQLIL